MDTLRVYLDNMFKALPNNQKVRDAKEELYSMMEDKYHLLKEEGKTENEAVGIVINEFGNLDEVAETLGIESEIGQKGDYIELSNEKIKKIVADYKDAGPKIGFGVMLIFIGIIGLLAMLALQQFEVITITEKIASIIGVCFLILMVAVAVYNFIASGSKLEEYEVYESQLVQLSYNDRKMLESEKEGINFYAKVARSVIMYIISPIPIILTSLLEEKSEAYILLGVIVTLLIVGFATYLLIKHGTIYNLYQMLLQEGDYTEGKKRVNKKYEPFISIYWSLIVIAYFAYSFLTRDWGRSWIIWPVAGITFGVISIYLDSKSKQM